MNELFSEREQVEDPLAKLKAAIDGLYEVEMEFEMPALELDN
jgi:hypothetical protein